ncbi:hypothetical protein ACH5RR_027983 [Cinchona calisaya]|uniref:Uncharacterized protein n=1 Tax=Cinchona calisaya TaxID=153742 RepID=A0ABD2YQP7_9GENT
MKKFLLELMTCCGSCSSTFRVKEEARLLVAPVPPTPSPSEICRVRGGGGGGGRKRGRGIMGRNYHSGGGGSSSSGIEWRPSLSSICEDNVLHERNRIEHHHHHNHQEMAVVKSSSSSSERNLKRKVTSTPRQPPREDVRRSAIHAAMPTFSPAPFMF